MMENTALVTKQELISKLVQEVAKRGDEVPEKYLLKDGFPEAIDAPDLWRDNLLIDFSLLSSSSTAELAKLRSALSQWGCFQVINHGIDYAFLEELIEVSRQFFAQPIEEKLKCFMEDDISQGYGNDSFFSGGQNLNWNDRLFLSLHPSSRKLQCWPEKPEKFRGMIDEYTQKITTVNKVICKAIAKSLDLEENCLNFGKQGPTVGRFTLYPSCSSPSRVLGSKPHTDGTTVTYLLPEKEVEGLQILKDDQWYNVTVIPGALFINFGNFGEIITNGVFKSSVHRVVTNSKKDRVSVTLLFIPDTNVEEIEPISKLISDQQPQVYKKVTISEYWQKFRESFALGTHPLDAFKL